MNSSSLAIVSHLGSEDVFFCLVSVSGGVNNKLVIITCGVVIFRHTILSDLFTDSFRQDLHLSRLSQLGFSFHLFGLGLLLGLVGSSDVDITARTVIRNIL